MKISSSQLKLQMLDRKILFKRLESPCWLKLATEQKWQIPIKYFNNLIILQAELNRNMKIRGL